jgi:uncharacterized membrane protein (DUF2068 family)
MHALRNAAHRGGSRPASTPRGAAAVAKHRPRQKPGAAGSRDALLSAIAIFKVAKALLLVAIGLGALTLLKPAMAHEFERWATAFAWRLSPRAVPAVEDSLARLHGSRLSLVGAAAFLYAGLFLVEGIGLWMERRWAEYLTIIATSSFVPFEVYELVRHVTLPRAVTLAVNLLVVGYLIRKVKRKTA